MFCTNCGNKLNTDDNFCGKCGKAANQAEEVKIEAPPVKMERPTFIETAVNHAPNYTPPLITPPRRKTTEVKAEKKRDELRAELKLLLEKQNNREVTDSELFEAEHWLRNYANLMYDLEVKEMQRQEKLKENPKGFHLEGEGYTCFICGNHVSNEQTWYDKYGIKCLICQNAIDKKIIPATAASDKDSWYSPLDLEHSFFINRFGIRKLVKEGLLKPRVVPDSNGGVHYQLFFIKDHEGILPPKKLTKWPMVKVQKDGEDWYHTEPWFKHGEAKEVLKGYKILDYLQTLEEKHIIKSVPELSFQIPKGARSIMKVNHIEQKLDPNPVRSEADIPK